MGCCTSENNARELALENDSLISENLNLLKAISMYLVDTGDYAMAVKVVNIRNITKSYYESVTAQRKCKFDHLYRFRAEDLQEFEEKIRKERNDLRLSAESLGGIYTSLTSRYIFFGPSFPQFIQDFKQKDWKFYDYQELKIKCSRYEARGKTVNELAKVLNRGKSLSKQKKDILRRICQYTTYIANNKSKRTDYGNRYHAKDKGQTRTIDRQKTLPRLIRRDLSPYERRNTL